MLKFRIYKNYKNAKWYLKKSVYMSYSLGCKDDKKIHDSLFTDDPEKAGSWISFKGVLSMISSAQDESAIYKISNPLELAIIEVGEYSIIADFPASDIHSVMATRKQDDVIKASLKELGYLKEPNEAGTKTTTKGSKSSTS
jgi:hypothetical protein